MNINWKFTKRAGLTVLFVLLILGVEWCLLLLCIESQLLKSQTALLILLGSIPLITLCALFTKITSETKLYRDISICNETLIQKLEDSGKITIIDKKKSMDLGTYNAIKVTAKYKERGLIFKVGYEPLNDASMEVRFFYEFQLELMNPLKQKLIVRDYLHPTPDTWVQGKYVCFLYEWLYNPDPLSSTDYDWVRGGTITRRDKKEKINFDNIKNRNVVQELDYLYTLAVRVDNGEFNAASE